METVKQETPFTLEDIRELQDFVGLVGTADPRKMVFADDVPVELQKAWMAFAFAKLELNVQLEEHGISKV